MGKFIYSSLTEIERRKHTFRPDPDAVTQRAVTAGLLERKPNEATVGVQQCRAGVAGIYDGRSVDFCLFSRGGMRHVQIDALDDRVHAAASRAAKVDGLFLTRTSIKGSEHP